MTRGQVRAATRRMKEHNNEAEEETGEINLVPYMDIVTNIIIFLLASVVNQVPLGNVNTSMPILSAGGAAAMDEQPQKLPLNLTVTVGATGFTIAASGGVLPLIPKLGGGSTQYNFKELTKKLLEIKSDPANTSETRVNFNADSHISYDVVVATLDAMRQDETGKLLFPDVLFSAGIL